MFLNSLPCGPGPKCFYTDCTPVLLRLNISTTSVYVRANAKSDSSPMKVGNWILHHYQLFQLWRMRDFAMTMV
ncbi:unnamed protein product [Allacma fusca]|uniref:Uncharacterized protein n=1 Tax=Allacma fusca TaxID=39272 RepID=A0A8J2JEL6_9HEXA|nr:unnamed protein product [Allacma fusca]